MTAQEALDRGYGDFAPREHVPGLVAGVISNGELTASLATGTSVAGGEHAVGPATRFRIASMTKSLTALCVLHLRDEGRLDLDRPVGDYVAELRGHAGLTGDAPPVTTRDLLGHLAGWVNDDPWADRQLGLAETEFSRFLSEGWPAARPARVGFEYSNLGYAILGRVVANVAGTSFQAYARQLLLGPLGMTASGFDWYAGPEGDRAHGHRWTGDGWVPVAAEPDGAFAAIGGLVTTAADYACYLAWLLAAWLPGDAPDDGPVRRATRRELALGLGPPWLPHDMGGRRAASVYGFGMVVSQVAGLGLVLHHAGGLPGFGSHVALLPHAGVAVFGFANRTYAQPFHENVRVLGLLAEAGALSPPPVAIAPALARAAAAVERAVRSGSAAPLAAVAASNFALDRPLDERTRELADRAERLGPIASAEVIAEHRLAGVVRLHGARGRLTCRLLLAPTPDQGLQSLTFDDAGV